MRHKEFWQCQGKESFGNKGDALELIRKIKETKQRRTRRSRPQERRRPYRCKICKKWHIGSTIKRNKWI
tara:strand:+ start:28364 stop:28570 length:207 start_codon:yes stop_codon:yes gene_type:complete